MACPTSSRHVDAAMGHTQTSTTLASARSSRPAFARRERGSLIKRRKWFGEHVGAILVAQDANKRALCTPLSCRASVVDNDTIQRLDQETLRKQKESSGAWHPSFRTFEECASHHRRVRIFTMLGSRSHVPQHVYEHNYEHNYDQASSVLSLRSVLRLACMGGPAGSAGAVSTRAGSMYLQSVKMQHYVGDELLLWHPPRFVVCYVHRQGNTNCCNNSTENGQHMQAMAESLVLSMLALHLSCSACYEGCMWAYGSTCMGLFADTTPASGAGIVHLNTIGTVAD